MITNENVTLILVTSSSTHTNKPRYSDTISLFSKYLVFIILQWFTNILSLSLMYIRNIDDIFCNIKEQVNDVNDVSGRYFPADIIPCYSAAPVSLKQDSTLIRLSVFLFFFLPPSFPSFLLSSFQLLFFLPPCSPFFHPLLISAFLHASS